MLGGAQSEENSLVQSSQDLRVDSENVDETEVSWGILPEKTQENIEDSQKNITSCRNEVGTLGTKDEEVTAEMDKGSMVSDSFRSEQECCADLALVWKHAKEGKGNYYEVDGYLFHRDKILGESIGQLVIPKCRRTEVLRLAHTSVFSSHMGPKKTLQRNKYSFFWEGLRANVKKFCESCKECHLTRSVRIKDRSPITPVARPELPFQVVNMDLIGPIDPPSSKGHKYILCLVDQHTRWGEAVPLTSLSAKQKTEKNYDIRHLAPVSPTSAIVEHRQYPKSVIVWGGICASGKTPLVFVVEGVKINQKVYRRDIIEAVVLQWDQKHFENSNWTLQQDSALVCKAKKAQECCKANFSDMISSEE
ncbi:retrovirus-related Pol polyprotein from transposon opus [Trichonephila clavipes]|nr:retrovirus-related Pol polyprotein from transposon opus [Trichonephila clavipes]